MNTTTSPTHLGARAVSGLPAVAPAKPDVVADEEQRPSVGDGDGDHDRFTHYVSRRDLERFRATGKPVTALCGKRWRPNADPSRFPMCATCSEIAAERLLDQLG